MKNIINYYRDCYQADSRAVNLLNFFGRKTAHILGLEEATLLEGQFEKFPVPTAWGEEVEKELQIYGKEKTLYCCSFFLSGKTTLLSKSQRIAAPLFLHAADLILEDEVYSVQIQPSAIINPTFVNSLPNSENDRASLYDKLCDALPTGYIGWDECQQIEAVLTRFFPDLDLSKLANYPLQLPLIETLKKQGPKADEFKLFPAIGMAILDKSTNTRGVLNELDELAKSNDFSAPLQALFSPKETTKSLKIKDLMVPVSLSVAQQNILQQAFQQTQTLVVGPPGTGKSFTIAALAVHALSEGKSVLIASKNSQAVDVVGNKIELDFGLKNTVLRASNRDYQRTFKKRLKSILSGVGVREVKPLDLVRAQRKVTTLNKRIRRLEKSIQARLTAEEERGIFLNEGQNSFLQRIKLWFLKRKIEQENPLQELLPILQEWTEKLHIYQREYIQLRIDQDFYRSFILNRGTFQSLLKGLQARQGNKKETIFKYTNFKEIFKALPIWIVGATDIHRVLPFQKELFDVVIIDEATQCDTASCLPLLQRAKHSIIVGDPKQLRHISFLSRAQQQQLVVKNGLEKLDFDQLNYRDKSLLDVVSDGIKSQHQVHFLDEHYRSLPDIISFSNQHFYEKALRVMTASPTTILEQNVFKIQVENGKRLANGRNKIEADQLLKHVAQIIDNEEDMSSYLCQKIGILSPFREQVNYLQQQVETLFSLRQLERHRVLVGTPHAFQGEERDVMFLSFAVDNDTHPSTFLYLQRTDVFNVSITRARSLQYCYLSIDQKNLKVGGLLSQYLDHIQHKTTSNTPPKATIRDTFLTEVKTYLEGLGIRQFHKAYTIAGVEIDLVIVHENQTYCIDLIGYPGAFEAAFTLEQYQILQRTGVPTLALPYSLWCLKREACERDLSVFLNIVYYKQQKQHII